MIPISDENPKGFIPFVNYLIIAINIFVFAFQIYTGQDPDQFYAHFGLIPANLTQYGFDPSEFLKIFTSMFVHGGIMHLAGNMLYLWIFGDNIEYTIGHKRYFIFYLIAGIGAALLQIIFNPDSLIPMVGASGAISGVLGAYLIKYPRNRISVLFFFFIIIRIIKIPAVIVLSFWFLIQLYNGYTMQMSEGDTGGVAWFAHIGGFVAGFVLIKLFEYYPKYK